MGEYDTFNEFYAALSDSILKLPSKDIKTIKVLELVASLHTYELRLPMASLLKRMRQMFWETGSEMSPSDATYLTRQFKKIINNSKFKGNDRTRPRKESFDRFKKDSKEVEDNPPIYFSDPSDMAIKGVAILRKKCATFLKSIGKGKAMAATLSDGESEPSDSDSDQEGKFKAFVAYIVFNKGTHCSNC